MTLPKYDEIMLPLLQFLKDGKERSMSEAAQEMEKHFKLTEEDQKQVYSSNQKKKVFPDRARWAKTYLSKANLIDKTGRGRFKINQRGLDLLKQNPSSLGKKELEQYPEFLEFIGKSKEVNTTEEPTQTADDLTPQDQIEVAHKSLRAELKDELLTQIIDNNSPSFFERLVVELLVTMGYGGSVEDAGQAVGQSGDEGIDGVIKEDRLGLDKIYLQAKKYKNTVPIAHVRDFAGAMLGKQATKGVFLTTSSFPKSAHDYVSSLQQTIILIDGDKLTDLMIEYRLGINVTATYHLMGLDGDYFDEFD